MDEIGRKCEVVIMGHWCVKIIDFIEAMGGKGGFILIVLPSSRLFCLFSSLEH